MALSPPFFVISDTHFYHRNIVKYCGRPYDHEAIMLKRWAHIIKPSDTVIHLGDLFFGGPEGFEQFREEIAPKLTGHKYLILGNHDKKKYDYTELGFTVIQPFRLKYRGFDVTFDHYPKLIDASHKHFHVHGHTHNHGYARGEAARPNNLNVSVEVIDYRPVRVTRLLNAAILKRKGK